MDNELVLLILEIEKKLEGSEVTPEKLTVFLNDTSLLDTRWDKLIFILGSDETIWSQVVEWAHSKYWDKE